MNKKLWLTLGTTTSLAAPVTALVSCSLYGGSSTSLKSDLEFYNYESYMGNNEVDDISSVYKYRTFGDLPEFETNLRKGNTVGGVGSDYFNASLAKKGLISKIDLRAIFPSIGTDRSKWEEKLQKFYTPVVWNILNSFNLGDVNNDGIEDKLWEYMLPYYSQNKVVAFNTGSRLEELHSQGKINDHDYNILKGKDQSAIDALFSDKTYEGIFTRLNGWGYSSLEVNDYMRDNMIIGSEELSSSHTATGMPASLSQGKKQIDAFLSLAKKHFGKNVTFETDGTKAFEAAMDNIETNKAERDVTLIYNGDAFDANDGSENGKANTIRVIIPKNSSFLLDGIVMSSIIKNDIQEKERFYTIMRESLYVGYDTNHSFLGYTGSWNRAYDNWNGDSGTGYTPAFRELIAYGKQNFSSDPVGLYLLTATEKANKQNPASIKTLAQPLDPKLQSQLEQYYELKIAS